MKREKTPPPSRRPGGAGRRKKVSGQPASPRSGRKAPPPAEPDMTGWTEGEKELYQLAIEQGKRPIAEPRSLAYGTPQDGEELLAFHRQIRADDARATKVRKQPSTS